MNYASIVKSNNTLDYAGGYKNVFLFCPRSNFLSIKKPTLVADVGDTLRIVTAHTFTEPNGFFTYDCKSHSVTLAGATVGEDGGQEVEWTATFIILGDKASTDEQLRRLLNDDVIALMKDSNCLENDTYVQLGDECVSPVFKVAFNGNTTKEGVKEYTVTAACKRKFFYESTVTYADAA